MSLSAAVQHTDGKSLQNCRITSYLLFYDIANINLPLQQGLLGLLFVLLVGPDTCEQRKPKSKYF